MAFVFQSERWKPQHPTQKPGPTYYNLVQKSKFTCGLIIPEHNSTKNKNKLTSQQQKLLLQGLDQRKQRYHHQSSQKLFKRAQSANVFKPVKPYLFHQAQKNIAQINNAFEITNSNSIYQNNQNQLKKCPTSFKKLNKFNNSNSQKQFSTNLLFNDKNLRTKNTSTPTQTKESHQFFNTCLNKQQKSNLNKSSLNKFVENKNKVSTQNSFIANEGNLPFKKDQNFMIASNNCKKVSLKHKKILSYSSNSTVLNGKIDPFEDVQTTAIDDSYDEEESFQYITDATPGPGQYQLRKDKQVAKSSVQKFGITEKRFKDLKKQQVVLNINAKMPNFKKQSRASQQKVAFGKSRPQTAKQNSSEFLLYEDYQSIQNKCIKNLIKDRTAPGTFLSKTNRFNKLKKQSYFGPDFFEKDKQKPVTLPDSTYMSKVQRHERPFSPTSNIDFQGQDHKTIYKKIQYLNQRKQIFDNQTPGFYVSEPRFKYKPKQQGQQPLQKLGKSSQKNKKQLKSYTFRRQQTKQKIEQIDSPAPWSYSTQMNWVKPSHHVRYKF